MTFTQIRQGATETLGPWSLADTGISAADVAAGAVAYVRIGYYTTQLERNSDGSEVTITSTEVSAEFTPASTAVLELGTPRLEVVVEVPGGEIRLVHVETVRVLPLLPYVTVPLPDPTDNLVGTANVIRFLPVSDADASNPASGTSLYHSTESGGLVYRTVGGDIVPIGGGSSPYIDLVAQDPEPDYSAGRLWYSDTDKAVTFDTGLSTHRQTLGRELTVLCRNITGVTITDGSVVYLSGASGNKPTIALASTGTPIDSLLGIATHDIANNANGAVTFQGEVSYDTSGFLDGDALYLSATPGVLSATPGTPRVHMATALNSTPNGRIHVAAPHLLSDNVFANAAGELQLAVGSISSGNYKFFHDDVTKGWVDVVGRVVPFPSGAGRPVYTAYSAPHANFFGYSFGIGDKATWTGHMPHGLDAAAGIYLHLHVMVDGTNVQPVRFSVEYTYAHGYSRQALSTPASVTLTATPSGTPKTHMIMETPTPVLAGQIETDGLIEMVVTRITNGGTDNTNPVFVLFSDAHVRVTHVASTNRNYPFE